MLNRLLRRAGVAVACGLALTAPAAATWSIIVVDTATREVVVAAATCLENFNLDGFLPVLRVREGAGASQGLVDVGGVNRKIIWDGLIAGDSGEEIIQSLVQDGSQIWGRQWGVVAFEGPAGTYTGSACGLAAEGLTGASGTLKYAIQGNLVTGLAVVTAAEDALLNTPGDLTTRVMAAMEAARAMGGDGRCSCLTGAPPDCGAPPPSFTKSAHCSFLIGSRQGDEDGFYHPSIGAANGDYYIYIDDSGDAADPDTVLSLQQDYNDWRANLAGRPDHLLSTASPNAAVMVADGASTVEVEVSLVDVEGVPLTGGGATFSIDAYTADGSTVPALANLVGTVDHGDGTYTLTLQADLTAGDQELMIRVDDGQITATLYPFFDVGIAPLVDLFSADPALSASAGGEVPFVINLGAAAANDPYLLLASASGTVPGVDLGGVNLPLNPDGVLTTTLTQAGGSFLPGSIGTLDAGGRGEAAFVAPAGFLASTVGVTLHFAALDYAAPMTASAPLAVTIQP